mgnify:CR=1
MTTNPSRTLPDYMWQGFELAPDGHLDINQMNPRGGRERLSGKLAALVRQDL